MEVKPYAHNDSKKVQVESMFNNIAHRYDFLNHFLSFGIDKYWRKKAISILSKENINNLLDIATGTGDLAIQISKKTNINEIVGVDISEGMLEVASKKVKDNNLSHKISFNCADSEELPLNDNHFDAVTVAFGVRNFENLSKGIEEMYRVLKENGKLVILEFSVPRNIFFYLIYGLYFTKILPLIGKIFSKDRKAYKYLPKSVEKFPDQKEFLDLLDEIGFSKYDYKTLTLGIVTVFWAKK